MNTRPPTPLQATGMAVLGMAVGHVLLHLAEAHDRARAARTVRPKLFWSRKDWYRSVA